VEQPGQAPETGDEIDPVVAARVRELLAASPEPGPMPERVAQRIESLLTDEVALRVDPGPLTQAEHDAAVLAPLIRQRQRPRPLFAVAAVAAAAAVVAVGGSALHLNKRANGVASLGDPSAVVTAPSAPSVTPSGSPTGSGPIGAPVGPSKPNLHIQLSSTNYTAADLPAQARALLTTPGMPIQVLAAEAPTLGPIATEVGLEGCLTAHFVPTSLPVLVDIATYEGEPAAVIVVTEDGQSTVRVVERTCTTGHPARLTGVLPVP
jgi:hypothetical protein